MAASAFIGPETFFTANHPFFFALRGGSNSLFLGRFENL